MITVLTSGSGRAKSRLAMFLSMFLLSGTETKGDYNYKLLARMFACVFLLYARLFTHYKLRAEEIRLLTGSLS